VLSAVAGAAGGGRAARRRGRRAARLRASAPAPARQQHDQRAHQHQHGRQRHEIGGCIEAAVARQREHRGAVLADERALDRSFVVATVDQALDERALAVSLRRLRDVERDFARHAHHLALDRRQRCAL
jgi:hypothetical protein